MSLSVQLVTLFIAVLTSGRPISMVKKHNPRLVPVTKKVMGAATKFGSTKKLFILPGDL